MISVTCSSCGRSLTLPDQVAGHEASCPYCNEPLRVPGSANQIGGRSSGSSLTELLKDSTADPSLAPADSEFRAAQRYRHVPGIFTLTAWGGIIYAVTRKPRTGFLETIGAPTNWGDWTLFVWLGVAFLAALACISTVSGVYYRYTGRVYTKDRIGFAKAGGYDIGSIAPLLGYGATYALYRFTFSAGNDPIEVIRSPWLFTVTGAVVAHLLTGLVAGFVFRSRFGTEHKSRIAKRTKVGASIKRSRTMRKADRLAKQGQRTEALAMLEEVARSARRDGAEEVLLITLEDQAGILFDEGRGDLDAALERFNEMEAVIRAMLAPQFSAGKGELLAGCLSGKAAVLMDMGNFDAAMAIHREIERFYRDNGDHRGLLVSLTNQANGLARAGREREALALIEEAHKLLVEHGPEELAPQVEAVRQYVRAGL